MDVEQLMAKANQHVTPSAFGDSTESPERCNVTRVFTTFNGHPVRVEFIEYQDGPADYRYNATVYDTDSETSDPVATGNGARTWDEALSIIHWQELTIRWGAGEN